MGPFCYEAVEVDVTSITRRRAGIEAALRRPHAQAIHEAQRRCMVEDVAAISRGSSTREGRRSAPRWWNDLFDRDWKDKASQQKKPERAFESYTRPSRKNLH